MRSAARCTGTRSGPRPPRSVSCPGGRPPVSREGRHAPPPAVTLPVGCGTASDPARPERRSAHPVGLGFVASILAHGLTPLLIGTWPEHSIRNELSLT